MTLTLHLGVVEVPYDNTLSQTPRRRKKSAISENRSTGDVAEILEDKYGIIQFFYDQHQDEIAALLEESLAGALETLMLGGPPQAPPFDAAAQKIEAMFRQFLSEREADGKIAGVPTKAALKGVSHRFAHPYTRRAARPSFIDTGLYENAFKAWLD